MAALSPVARLRSLARAARSRAGRALRDYKGYRLSSLVAAAPEFDGSDLTPRINLIALGIGPSSQFGGTATAIRFLRAIEPLFARSRIVVIAENEGDFDEAAWRERT